MARSTSTRGFTFTETLISIAVFTVVALAVFGTYVRIFDIIQVTRSKVIALALVNEWIEITRNLPYTDVGIVNGLPEGKIPSSQTIERNGKTFTLDAIVRNIDDSFDGTLGGVPNDLSPADYKLVEFEINCTSCDPAFNPMEITTYVAPLGLETASDNGALFVQVFDANGLPVQDANVHVENNATSSPIVIDDVTNSEGMLQIVDAPPATEAWEVTVTKTGYSSDQTHSVSVENPNPAKPHATVATSTVTQISFAIDKTSTIDVTSVTQSCVPVTNIPFTLTGSKLIGTSPDVPKYSVQHTTDGNGLLTLSNIEWDTYDIEFSSPTFDLIGVNPLLPFAVLPNSTMNLQLVVQARASQTLLIAVKDAATDLPVSDAFVSLKPSTGATTTKTTGRGFLSQTDWRGGPGQVDFNDPTMYFSSDGNIEDNDPIGEIKLNQILGLYASSGELTSSSFNVGANSNFHDLTWLPLSQPPETGTDSVKFQVATNNDNVTWNYIGPNGTTTSYYTTSDSALHDNHDGDQYLRYKVFMNTASTSYTPIVSDVSFTFTSSCVPPGQVHFNNLTNGDYTLTITKAGYVDYVADITVSQAWEYMSATINPE